MLVATRHKKSVEERFWEKVQKGDGCWEWQAAKYRNGYGRLHIGTAKDGFHNICAHRAAFLLSGGSIPDGMQVLHTCDNRGCVRPDHLFVGTPKDNMQDMVQKGRHAWQVDPTKTPTAKLNQTLAAEIRHRYAQGGYTYLMLGQEYGVHQSAIGGVITGRAWRREEGNV